MTTRRPRPRGLRSRPGSSVPWFGVAAKDSHVRTRSGTITHRRSHSARRQTTPGCAAASRIATEVPTRPPETTPRLLLLAQRSTECGVHRRSRVSSGAGVGRRVFATLAPRAERASPAAESSRSTVPLGAVAGYLWSGSTERDLRQLGRCSHRQVEALSYVGPGARAGAASGLSVSMRGLSGFDALLSGRGRTGRRCSGAARAAPACSGSRRRRPRVGCRTGRRRSGAARAAPGRTRSCRCR
jgi:hypothetical protein